MRSETSATFTSTFCGSTFFFTSPINPTIFCHHNSRRTEFFPSAEMPRAAASGVTTTKIHIMALDGIVNVNSLFTLALFLGLSWYPTTPSLVKDKSCAASSAVAEDLICFHVYSFSSFLFSSLIAVAMKQTIKAVGEDGGFVAGLSESLVHVNLVAFRVGILVSGFGSVFGCGFLTVALVNLVQIKLGTLACGSSYTLAAITPLITLVPLALFIYVLLVLYAFSR